MAHFLVAKLHLGMVCIYVFASLSTCSRALLNNSSSLSASRCWPQLLSSALTPTPFPRFPTGKLLHCNYIHNRGALNCIALLASHVFVQALSQIWGGLPLLRYHYHHSV